jgi:hypothetical protein
MAGLQPSTVKMFVPSGRPDAMAEWRGRWRIIGGTADMEDTRGRGTWWGPGWLGDPEEPGVIYRDGEVHHADD